MVATQTQEPVVDSAPIDRIACGGLLTSLLTRDGWTVGPPVATDKGALARAVFVARRGDRRIGFYCADQDRAVLGRAFRSIAREDGNRFETLAVLIVPDRAALAAVRQVREARRYPRVLFTAVDELETVVSGRLVTAAAPPGNVMAFRAKLLANDQVGGPDSPYYILRFQAPDLEEVTPSQFVMMDCAPQRLLLHPRRVRLGRWSDALELMTEPILKRPFGIQRAYHRHFDKRYLQRLNLPPSIALALHPVYPHAFDLLYKVLDGGVGTNLMTRLRPGQKVDMLGPLGRPCDVRELRAAGIEEVHVIGGGVGMAPLILLVQALRYYSFRVKVFIGISRLPILAYRGDVASSFAEEPDNAYVYIDDLLEAGLDPADLYLSFDTEAPAEVVRGIPAANLYQGFITDQYRQFLAATAAAVDRAGRVMAYTCGPDKMMELVYDIARGRRPVAGVDGKTDGLRVRRLPVLCVSRARRGRPRNLRAGVYRGTGV